MIFCIVGSQKFQFDRMIREIDRLAGSGVICDEVVAQIGACSYEPKHLKWQRFMDKDEFDSNIRSCDLLITHAGEGSIMTGLLMGKKVIAIPRYQHLGEHVSDHQLQIARAMEKQKCLINVEDTKELEHVLLNLDSYELEPYVSGKAQIMKLICNFIEK